MKKFIAIIAFMGILLQTFNQVLIIAEYYANQEYIAKNLCENRNKPQMHCNGKCHLKKQLAKEGKEQIPSPRNQKYEEVVTLFYGHNTFAINSYPNINSKVRHYSYDDLRTFSYHGSVFHPPSA